MEIRVNRDVENIGKRIEQGKTAKKNSANLSAWEQYLQKRKDQQREKKLQRKMASGNADVDGTTGALDADELEKLLPSRKKLKVLSGQSEEADKVTSDPRLQALLENPDFAVDTTHPSFDKKSAVLRGVIAEKSRRKKNK
jgi:hypothetical protein